MGGQRGRCEDRGAVDRLAEASPVDFDEGGGAVIEGGEVSAERAGGRAGRGRDR